MSDPDARQPDTAPDPSPDSQTAERGAWLDIVSACTALGVTERTIQRRVERGLIQRRTVSGGRAEFWISDGVTTDLSPVTPDMAQNERSAMLALFDRQEALIDHLSDLARQQQAPLVQRIEELAAENGRLKAELAAARQAPTVTAVTPDTRPRWMRWLWP